jgi:K+-sensing histidine kinase KdpD
LGRSKIFIACVTCQQSCGRIIRAAKAIAENCGAKLEVLSVLSETGLVNSEYDENLAVFDYLHGVCGEVGADMTILYSESPSGAVLKYIKKKSARHSLEGIIAGEPEIKETGFIEELSEKFPQSKIIVIPKSYDSGGLMPVSSVMQP